MHASTSRKLMVTIPAFSSVFMSMCMHVYVHACLCACIRSRFPPPALSSLDGPRARAVDTHRRFMERLRMCCIHDLVPHPRALTACEERYLSSGEANASRPLSRDPVEDLAFYA